MAKNVWSIFFQDFKSHLILIISFFIIKFLQAFHFTHVTFGHLLFRLTILTVKIVRNSRSMKTGPQNTGIISLVVIFEEFLGGLWATHECFGFLLASYENTKWSLAWIVFSNVRTILSHAENLNVHWNNRLCLDTAATPNLCSSQLGLDKHIAAVKTNK